ncbi:hypothetical protein ALC60_07899 [Trachymyrmex zeteki]|uniref:Uncharacterized protein n=1 Tax=Mycetomoellerius zeteki TaxID=64791 RepID=A0A151WZ57_9HYME|nr:hypothetical protein ALC60_07899 [Trachymyrmex zeteki]
MAIRGGEHGVLSRDFRECLDPRCGILQVARHLGTPENCGGIFRGHLESSVCSISPRSFHARMETGCGGLHVLLRAPASSCKGAVDDYNAVDIVVHCDLMRYTMELHPLVKAI